MPIYEYLCERCSTLTEKMQSVNEKPLKKCPVCGGKVNKVFHPVGIMFKGSGFHITDYVHPEREKKQKAKAGDEGSSATTADASAGSGSSTEAKTETKTETKQEKTGASSTSEPTSGQAPKGKSKKA